MRYQVEFKVIGRDWIYDGTYATFEEAMGHAHEQSVMTPELQHRVVEVSAVVTLPKYEDY